jgi:hypothetical protein
MARIKVARSTQLCRSVTFSTEKWFSLKHVAHRGQIGYFERALGGQCLMVDELLAV